MKANAALAMRLEGKTYAEIGAALGLTRQRAHQLVSPPKEVAARIRERASGSCEGCGKSVSGQVSHLHHRQAEGMTPETYNTEPNLTVLCISCHQHAHRGHAKPKPRLTTEQWRAMQAKRGIKRGAAALGITTDEYRAHREAGERWCWVHQSWEPVERFGPCRSAFDGLMAACRDGNRESARAHYSSEYRRRYYAANRKRINAYQAEWLRRRRAQERAS